MALQIKALTILILSEVKYPLNIILNCTNKSFIMIFLL